MATSAERQAGGTRPAQAIERCPQCDGELVVIGLVVDGTNLVMRACATCDTRSWHLGPQRIDLDTVLDAVGSSSARRRR